MKHQEQNLQIKCVKWFRIQHPALAKLLFHPKNEGATANARRIGGIAKAEGVVAGVADLILLLPSEAMAATALAIEMKTAKGRQSPEQRAWQQYFEAAGGYYVIVRSFDEFTDVVNRYLTSSALLVKNLKEFHRRMEFQEAAAAKARLQNLLGKQEKKLK